MREKAHISLTLYEYYMRCHGA